jgi:acetate kinase
MDAFLVVNAASSSLKFQVFRHGAVADLQCLIKGKLTALARGRGPYMVPTDEELMIARHTLALVSRSGTQPHLS